jgi:hypothetical protein
MHYDLHKPCNNCPFLRKGGIRLHPSRVREIAGMMLSTAGGDFPCHKTTVEARDGFDRRATKDSRHCAGALIFAEKNGNATQLMRIMERLGFYDAQALMKDKSITELVFDDMKEMLDAK